MNSTMVKTYQNRIVTANRKELLLLNYEMLIAELEEAIVGVDADDETAFDHAMVKAHGFLRELSDNLNTEYDVSKNLMSIYIYMNKRMIEASLYYDKEALLEVKEVLGILLVGWEQADPGQYGNESVVQNSQKVYAGLTYGKGSLNESVYDGVESRGFKA